MKEDDRLEDTEFGVLLNLFWYHKTQLRALQGLRILSNSFLWFVRLHLNCLGHIQNYTVNCTSSASSLQGLQRVSCLLATEVSMHHQALAP